MVVHDLNVFGAVIGPAEAHAILIIHADAMLTGTVAFQGFQPITRWHAQIIQSACLVQLFQLAACHRLYVDEAAHPLAMEQRFRIRALERLNHAG